MILKYRNFKKAFERLYQKQKQNLFAKILLFISLFPHYTTVVSYQFFVTPISPKSAKTSKNLYHSESIPVAFFCAGKGYTEISVLTVRRSEE